MNADHTRLDTIKFILLFIGGGCLIAWSLHATSGVPRAFQNDTNVTVVENDSLCTMEDIHKEGCSPIQYEKMRESQDEFYNGLFEDMVIRARGFNSSGVTEYFENYSRITSNVSNRTIYWVDFGEPLKDWSAEQTCLERGGQYERWGNAGWGGESRCRWLNQWDNELYDMCVYPPYSNEPYCPRGNVQPPPKNLLGGYYRVMGCQIPGDSGFYLHPSNGKLYIAGYSCEGQE